MTDLATLKMAVDSREVRSASGDLDKMTQAGGRAENQTKKTAAATREADGVTRAFNATLGALGLAYAASRLKDLADGYTTYTNRLKVAGLEGENLRGVQDRLFQTAQRYGVELVSLGTLYGRISGAAKDLGASQNDMLRFVETTAAALKVQGGAASESSGALLQLSQMLGGSKVQAQEFNSLIDGARPLLQAVAAGSDRWAGSVSKLTQDVKKGTVSSQEFFEAALKGQTMLEEKAGKASLTISGGFTILENSIMRFIGQADQALGVTKAITGAMVFLAQNIDVAVAALVVLGVSMAVVFGPAMVAGIGAATTAVLGFTAALLANPIGLVVVAVVALGAALWALGDDFDVVKDNAKTAADETLTMKDYMIGAFMAVGDAAGFVWRAISDGWRQAVAVMDQWVKFLSDKFGGSFTGIGDLANKSANFIIGVYVGAVRSIGVVWDQLPALMKSAAVAAMNGFISAVETGVNAAATSLLGGPLAMFLTGGKGLQLINIPRLKTDADTASGIVLGTVAGIMSEATSTDWTGAIGKAWTGYAERSRDAALADQDAAAAAAQRAADAVDASDKAAGGKDRETEAEKRLNKAREDAKRTLEAIRYDTATMGMTEERRRSYDAELAAIEAETAGRAALALVIQSGSAARIAAATAERDQLFRLAEAIRFADAAWQEAYMREEAKDIKLTKLDLGAVNDRLAAQPLEDMVDRMDEVVDRARDLRGALTDAFGDAGDAAGGVVVALTRVKQAQALILEQWQKADKLDPASADRNRAKAMRELSIVSVQGYGDMAASAKGFFKEKSTGYRVIEAVEKGFRAFEAAQRAQAMVQDAIETAKHITNAMARAGASTTAGAAKVFEQLGTLGFPVAAALLAFMASLGVGSGGSGGSGAAYDLEGVQSRQGTGTVLGSPDAKSESIANSLKLVAENTHKDLEYSNAMLKSLRAINDAMSAVAASIARAQGTGVGLLNPAMVDGTKTSSPIPKLLDPLGLFGSKTTTKLLDQGLSFGSQSLTDLLAGGVNAKFFNTVQSTKESKFFGISTGSKTSTKDQTSAIDATLSRELALVVGSMKDSVVAAAGVIGIAGAEAVLASFAVNIGKVSFKDMDAQQISDTLNAVFSKVGDQMSMYLMPSLAEFQKAGEGAFETLMRLAREYQTVDVYLKAIGMTFNGVGLASLKARDLLIEAVGGIEEFTDQTSAFADAFLSDAERIGIIQSSVSAEMARLGYAAVDTKDEFKSLVQGLDLSTEAGRTLFASLMAVAPAFATVADYAADALASAKEATGKARDDLVNAYKREAGAMQDTIDRFTTFGNTLRTFRQSLNTGPMAALSPTDAYNTSKATFLDTLSRANSGDQSAMNDLRSVSEAFLNASRSYNATSTGYFDDLSAVKAALDNAIVVADSQRDVAQEQLDALTSMVNSLTAIEETALSVVQAITALNVALAAQEAAQTATGGSGAATVAQTLQPAQAALSGAPSTPTPSVATETSAGAAAPPSTVTLDAETVAVLTNLLNEMKGGTAVAREAAKQTIERLDALVNTGAAQVRATQRV